MTIDQVFSDFFTAGGTLPPDAPSYVKRPTDDELFKYIMAGEFCYVLTSRQMGKSSLMIRTAQRLLDEGVKSAVVDLTVTGAVDSEDEWYKGILTQIKRRLRSKVDPVEWWEKRRGIPNIQKFIEFFEETLVEIKERVVIFIDEIDTTLRLDFRDDFFAGIRAIFNARAENPDLKRITYVLLGVASPSDLIKDPTRTPFNIGHAVSLEEFSLDDAKLLQDGIEQVHPGNGQRIIERIFYWTSGHPYLTQKICKTIVESKTPNWPDDNIDSLVRQLFLTEESRNEYNIKFVRDRILNSKRSLELVSLYRRALSSQQVEVDGQDTVQNEIMLSGLLKSKGSYLTVRNRIYQTVFDRNWIDQNLSLLSKPPIDSDLLLYSGTFFVAGGTLRADVPSYVKRPADDELFNALIYHEYCYILTPRQMGKSSLMIRTSQRLRNENIKTALVDIQAIGTTKIREWYASLLSQIRRGLKLSVDIDKWMRNKNTIAYGQLFAEFIQDVVLIEISEQVVIFLDEVDWMIKIPFRDDFFASIRSIYNARANYKQFNRISFVILGVASPADLIPEPTRTPFNIGHAIPLQEFSLEDATPLEDGLEQAYPGKGTKILKRIFYWTSGHPYLTQKMCNHIAESRKEEDNVAESRRTVWSDSEIDNLVNRLFLTGERQAEPNLRSVQDRILGSEQFRELLKLYRRSLTRKVKEDTTHIALQSQLLLSGLVRSKDGYLTVRNEIYRRTFSKEWIASISTQSTMDDFLGLFYDYHGSIQRPNSTKEKVWAAPSNLPKVSLDPQNYFLHYFQSQLKGPTTNECVTTAAIMGMNIMEDRAASRDQEPIQHIANLRLEDYTQDLDARESAGWLYRFSTKSFLPGMMTPWQAVLALRHHAEKLNTKYGRSYNVRLRSGYTVNDLIDNLKQRHIMLIHGAWRILWATAIRDRHLPFLGGMPHTMLLVGYDPEIDSWLFLDPARNYPPSIHSMTTKKLIVEFWGRKFLFYPPRFSVTVISPDW